MTGCWLVFVFFCCCFFPSGQFSSKFPPIYTTSGKTSSSYITGWDCPLFSHTDHNQMVVATPSANTTSPVIKPPFSIPHSSLMLVCVKTSICSPTNPPAASSHLLEGGAGAEPCPVSAVFSFYSLSFLFAKD